MNLRDVSHLHLISDMQLQGAFYFKTCTAPSLAFYVLFGLPRIAMMFTAKLYPKAHETKIHGTEKAPKPIRKAFLKAASLNFILLQILFLGLFAYIFGALFQQAGHTHNLNVLYIDYDGGVVGQSVRDAYKTLQADSFPTLLEKPATQFPVEGLEREVCRAKYWAVLYSSPGASTRLEAALGGSTASTYNRSDVLTFIWNEARYSTIVDSAIQANLQTLSSTSRVVYSSTNGTIQSLAPTNPSSVSIFANPWTLSSVNIQPTTQGSRLIYNTLVIILILIQEFFYLGTINGLYAAFKIYTKFSPHRIIIFRNAISLAYTFIGSLCVAGAIWAFRAGWNVNGNQFALSWAILWLFAHVNFLSLDVFTVWLAPQFVPMALVSWIVFNVASILLPFELSPAFYKWAYAMPAHEVYQVLTDIWSGGCVPELYYALPVLFAWEVVMLVLSGLGVHRRVHYAVLGEEAAERAFNGRIDAAMAFERKKEAERKEQEPSIRKEDEPSVRLEGEGETADVEAADREGLAEVIEKEMELEKQRTKSSRVAGFGPSFDLAYRDDSHQS
jgi:hypothetical protein